MIAIQAMFKALLDLSELMLFVAFLGYLVRVIR